MTLGGWIVLLLSVSSVTALFLWCVYKVLSTPNETEKLHDYKLETPEDQDET